MQRMRLGRQIVNCPLFLLLRASFAISAVTALLATTPSNAQVNPDQLNYSYVGYGYVDLDFDQGEGDGHWIDVSLAMTGSVHFFGSYQNGEIDPGNLDYTSHLAGVGINLPILGETDFMARAGYVYAEIKGRGYYSRIERLSDTGLTLYGGLRRRFPPSFEFDAGVDYTDLGDFGDDTSFCADARWYFFDRLALAAGVEVGDDVNAWTIGLRKELPFN